MKLLAPNPDRLQPRTIVNAQDRAQPWVADGTPSPLRDDLRALLGEDKVLSRALDLVRYASDASPYRLIPQVVVMSHGPDDVRKVMAYAADNGRHVTFRSAGTSLNGQSQGDGILVDVRRHWAGVDVLDSGRRLRCGPGTTIGYANLALLRHGYVLGPDPASSAAATVGGVVANNASGMAAGVRYNSYRTIESLTFVLPSGTTIDTAQSDADDSFAAAEPALTNGLMQIKDQIRADPELADRIRRKFQIKNTNGYRLDAFLDGDTPLEIFRRLLVGSEGTLAFLAEVVFETLPLLRRRATAMLLFDSLQSAVEAVPQFVAAGAPIVELMDGSSFRTAAQHVDQMPKEWTSTPDAAGTLLVELRAADDAALDTAVDAARKVAHDASGMQSSGTDFVRDPAQIDRFWKMRNGLEGFAGMSRPTGSTMFLEDVCVAPERVAEAAAALMDLQDRFGYPRNVAGHASAGNLHFLINVNVSDDEQRSHYGKFMDELSKLFVDTFDGSLKAEHGTGRNMAPFVEREWGPNATELMWRVKELADPHYVLSPDVILTRDPQIHLKDMCSVPTIESVAERCIQCGFCEHVCPSRDLTTTPRQRIVLRREMARQPADSPVLQALLQQYEYDAIETCAGDGSCALACPVTIDTGVMMKGFRHQEHSLRAERVARAVAKRWGTVERVARLAVASGNTVAKVFGQPSMAAVTTAARWVVDNDLMPAWTATMPQATKRKLPETYATGAAAVYFPACINRIFGQPKGIKRKMSLPEAMVEVSRRAGLPVWIPHDVVGACCATVWHSKGYQEGNTLMAARIVERMWRWTNQGQLPVVVDASSCTLGITQEIVPYLSDQDRRRLSQMTVYDSITWAAQYLLPKLTITRPAASATVHATCSTRHLQVDQELVDLAGQLAHDVHVPLTDTCCAFAGDRGFLHNELTRSATAHEAGEVRGSPTEAYLCSNRTCEVGLQQATGAPYESVIFLLEAATSATR